MLEVLKCFVRVVRICSTCFFFLCVCVGGGGGVGGKLSTSPSVKKITDPLLLINDWFL